MAGLRAICARGTMVKFEIRPRGEHRESGGGLKNRRGWISTSSNKHFNKPPTGCRSSRKKKEGIHRWNCADYNIPILRATPRRWDFPRFARASEGIVAINSARSTDAIFYACLKKKPARDRATSSSDLVADVRTLIRSVSTVESSRSPINQDSDQAFHLRTFEQRSLYLHISIRCLRVSNSDHD